MSQQEPRSQSKCPKFVLQAELERGLCSPPAGSSTWGYRVREWRRKVVIRLVRRNASQLASQTSQQCPAKELSTGLGSTALMAGGLPQLVVLTGLMVPPEEQGRGGGVPVLPPGVLPGAAPCPQSPSVPLGNIPSDYSLFP